MVEGGVPITNWNDAAWIQARKPGNDGDPDDALQSYLFPPIYSARLRKDAKAYRDAQASLIDQGNFGAAQQMDINDVWSKFGPKYDDAIRQMMDYMKKMGY